MSEDPTRAMPPSDEEPASSQREPTQQTERQGQTDPQSIDQTRTQRRLLIGGGIGCVLILCVCVGLAVAGLILFDSESDAGDVAEAETPTPTAIESPTETPEPTPTAEPTAIPEATATPESVATPTPTPEATPEPTPTVVPTITPVPTVTPGPDAPEGAFADGTFIVGEDIEPGLYFANDPSGACYWERLSGFSGELDDIISNYFGDHRQIVRIDPDDAGFSTQRCGLWIPDGFPVRDDPAADLPDGTYLIGDEVEPGTWQSEGADETCYWARLNGFGAELDDIISNNFGGVGDVVQISPDDVGFESSNCGSWVRIGD